MGPSERDQGREDGGPRDHRYAERDDAGTRPRLAERHVGMQQIVDREHQQEQASRDLKVSDGHPEEAEDGVPREQEPEADRGRG